MKIRVNFYSFFKDMTKAEGADLELQQGDTVQMALDRLYEQFPVLRPMQNSSLIAIGVDYATKDQSLQEGDVMSLFPPVQGG